MAWRPDAEQAAAVEVWRLARPELHELHEAVAGEIQTRNVRLLHRALCFYALHGGAPMKAHARDRLQIYVGQCFKDHGKAPGCACLVCSTVRRHRQLGVTTPE
jgi:hypothetical protein